MTKNKRTNNPYSQDAFGKIIMDADTKMGHRSVVENYIKSDHDSSASDKLDYIDFTHYK